MQLNTAGQPVKALRNPTLKGINRRTDKGFSHRVPFLQREKAAYAILRRKGLSINQISKAFGRSTSLVHRVLKRLEWSVVRRFDMRKLPYRAHMRAASFKWARMLKLLSFWEAWICGEGEEPP